MKTIILYNPLSDNSNGKIKADTLCERLTGDIVMKDITSMEPYTEFFASIDPTDDVIICGGDGTLFRFANEIADLSYPNRILYYAAGSGSDFWRDLGREPGADPIEVSAYIKNLPSVTVKGNTCRFIDNVGFGIDGYCCEVGDKMRAENPGKKINYAGIAIKGLLFHYKPTSAVINIDGKEYRYENVWLAPTMNGRYYGGGMMVAPGQDRLNADGTVTVVVMHCRSKLKTLAVFPSIFKGEHIKHTEMVTVHTGHKISVEFDRPVALQIDGDTVLGVTSYKVITAKGAQAKEAARAEAVGTNA